MSDLFDQIGNLWEKKEPVTTATKPSSTYMSIRMVSLNASGFLIADILNQFGRMPDELKLPALYHALPKRKRPWDKYPKKAKDELPKSKLTTLDRIQRHFNVDEHHGMQIMSILESQGVDLRAEYAK